MNLHTLFTDMNSSLLQLWNCVRMCTNGECCVWHLWMTANFVALKIFVLCEHTVFCTDKLLRREM